MNVAAIRFFGLAAAAAVASACTASPAWAQVGAPATPTTSASTATAATSATRAQRPPVIDGREDDDVWRGIAPTRGFRQFEPGDDVAPTFETEFRLAYDNENLYVLVRAYDPHPDSIVPLLSRRDVRTNSDQIKIIVDGFLDKRNAIQLMVNPAGVKRDASIYADATEDVSWDGVWDVGVAIDDKGWVAEFRLPFSQLRFAARDVNTFGFGVWRDIARLNQRDSWPVYRRASRTIVSQLGTVGDIQGVPAARRIELLPYTVAKSVPNVRTPGGANVSDFTGGLDAKIGLGSNITMDATINPDFGQVEADPSILNLTAFETRFEERRPFFQEGIGLFRCGPPCEGPFYTRRIGRTPQLRTNAADPAFTTILGAAKITGRLNRGFTLAMLNAVTKEEHGVSGAVIEPQTNYFVARGAREWGNGTRQAGISVTDVRRQLDKTTDPFLRRSATAVIGQSTIRFDQGRHELLVYGGQSFVYGTPAAMARTQRSSVHYFQRPGSEMAYDSTRTSLTGGAVGASIKKIRGAVRYETFVRRSTPGQEMNDLGLVPTVNSMSIRQSLDYQQLSPNRWFRSSFSTMGLESQWTVGGLPAAKSASVHASGSLHNNWAGALTYNADGFGGVNCVSCARGGPALRRSFAHTLRLDIVADPRPAFVPRGNVRFGRGDEGRTRTRGGEASAELRVASQFSASLGAGYEHAINDQQWVGNFDALLSDTTHYTFARLDQRTLAITARMNWTATPNLSFQFYGQPFISAGSYTNWRELDDPSAPRYRDRFKTYRPGSNPAGFNVKQFNSNAVVRWEYRPGSALFLVWQQGRDESTLDRGSFDGPRDIRSLFSALPQNTLLLKASYWFNP